MEQSPLLRLPPELRNHIYRYIFQGTKNIRPGDRNPQHAITKVCRRLRSETLVMDYATVQILPTTTYGISPVPWLRTIGLDACSNLQSIGKSLASLVSKRHFDQVTQQVSQPCGKSRWTVQNVKPGADDPVSWGPWRHSVYIALLRLGMKFVNVRVSHKYGFVNEYVVYLRPGEELLGCMG